MIALLRDEVNTKSFQTQQKYIDKVFKQDYDVFKRNESEVNNMSEEQKSNNEKIQPEAFWLYLIYVLCVCVGVTAFAIVRLKV